MAAETTATPSRPSTGGGGRTNRKSRIGAVLALLEQSKGTSLKQLIEVYGESGMTEDRGAGEVVPARLLDGWIKKEKRHTIIEDGGRFRVGEPVLWGGSMPGEKA